MVGYFSVEDSQIYLGKVGQETSPVAAHYIRI